MYACIKYSESILISVTDTFHISVYNNERNMCKIDLMQKRGKNTASLICGSQGYSNLGSDTQIWLTSGPQFAFEMRNKCGKMPKRYAFTWACKFQMQIKTFLYLSTRILLAWMIKCNIQAASINDRCYQWSLPSMVSVCNILLVHLELYFTFLFLSTKSTLR